MFSVSAMARHSVKRKVCVFVRVPIGVHEGRAAQRELRILVESALQTFDRVGSDKGVAVQKEQAVAVRRLDADVHRGGESTAWRLDDANARLVRDAPKAVVRRRFVSHDDLVHFARGDQRVDALLEELAAVAMGYHGRDRHARRV